MATGRRSSPTVLRFYGQGLGISAAAPARALLAVGTSDADRIAASGPAAPGDSGAGVLTPAGRALAVVSSLGAAVGPEPGFVILTRLAPQRARAAQRLGTRLELRTAARTAALP